MISKEKLHARLAGIVGEGRVGDFDPSRLVYPQGYPPQLRGRGSVHVRVRGVGEVEEVLTFAAREKVPVTPMGGLTSLRGQAFPVAGGIALDLAEMRGVVELDGEGLNATVLPGTTYRELVKALGEKGFAPRVQPLRSEGGSVGGFVAEGGLGMGTLKYGLLAGQILELTLTNPYIKTNRLYRFFFTPRKDPSHTLHLGSGKVASYGLGYNLKELVIGSEGTLGVITRITMALRSSKGEVTPHLYGYSELADALAASASLLKTRATPFFMAILNPTFMEILGVQRGEEGGHYLLAVYDKEDAELRRHVERICQEVLGVKGRRDEASVAPLWSRVRLGLCHPPREGRRILAEELKISTSSMGAAWGEVESLGKGREPEVGIAYCPLSPGGGLLLIVSEVEESSLEEVAGFEGIASEIRNRLTASLGAVPYGVGLVNGRLLEETAPLKLMGRVKRVMDPGGVLNPGKIFPQPKTEA